MSVLRYSQPPSSISFKEISSKAHCLAPSKYAKFIPPETDRVDYKNLDSLIRESKNRAKIKFDSTYQHIEIGDVDVNWGRINYRETPGFEVPKNPLMTQRGDILISKVRTHRKGIAFVDIDDDDLVCTSAFLLIRGVDNAITKEYIYAVLRHDIFTEQILSMQNRGSYPRLDKHVKKQVLLPIPKDEHIIQYITYLMRAIINKNREITNKYRKIEAIIENEILNNQKPNKFVYSSPTYKEIKLQKRLDTGLYKEGYKRILNLLENYSNSYFYIPEDKIKGGGTPPKRVIGTGDKNWVTPSIITDLGYFNSEDKILCNESNISKDCTLIINRTFKGGIGEYVGISAFYDFTEKGIGQHNQGLYRIEDYPQSQLKLLTILLNSKLYRKLCGHISMGSKMREIKSPNVTKIPILNLRPDVANKLISLYSYRDSHPKLNLKNFIEIDRCKTKSTGILELSYQIHEIYKRLDYVIDKIYSNEPFEPNFDFLNKKI